ncbi:hypothetical protein ACIBG0_37105 [Nocardia sp. NPDC050630]|uniref:hypothetical protein n=1 Tax=Nocardia sp. NPDC050630 TaxID=3364321 RepID=UPI0037979050
MKFDSGSGEVELSSLQGLAALHDLMSAMDGNLSRIRQLETILSQEMHGAGIGEDLIDKLRKDIEGYAKAMVGVRGEFAKIPVRDDCPETEGDITIADLRHPRS